uniref:PUB domain-containing protein n=1 Tax=Vitrella brassicaformis TaxID=1169539 RepID=A0A7S1JWI7_9ALVE|mmetsp:Transcript_28307/g.70710  ORF Transcript_28307/g.70710 Transcript_28307/m.70710 type:complete len:408 (+) Transcript_28307:129-1352(+)
MAAAAAEGEGVGGDLTAALTAFDTHVEASKREGALKILHKLVNNLATCPSEERNKYRVVKKSNQAIKEKLLDAGGDHSTALLAACGFTESGDIFRYPPAKDDKLQSTLAAVTEHLNASAAAVQKDQRKSQAPLQSSVRKAEKDRILAEIERDKKEKLSAQQQAQADQELPLPPPGPAPFAAIQEAAASATGGGKTKRKASTPVKRKTAAPPGDGDAQPKHKSPRKSKPRKRRESDEDEDSDEPPEGEGGEWEGEDDPEDHIGRRRKAPEPPPSSGRNASVYGREGDSAEAIGTAILQFDPERGLTGLYGQHVAAREHRVTAAKNGWVTVTHRHVSSSGKRKVNVTFGISNAKKDRNRYEEEVPFYPIELIEDVFTHIITKSTTSRRRGGSAVSKAATAPQFIHTSQP